MLKRALVGVALLPPALSQRQWLFRYAFKDEISQSEYKAIANIAEEFLHKFSNPGGRYESRCLFPSAPTPGGRLVAEAINLLARKPAWRNRPRKGENIARILHAFTFVDVANC